jgi:hypothetical protein
VGGLVAQHDYEGVIRAMGGRQAGPEGEDVAGAVEVAWQRQRWRTSHTLCFNR